jgi:polyisoprenoid-binding protein YceI
MKCLLTCLLLAFYLGTSAQHYTPADAGSTVSFAIKNFGATVNGTFKGLKGTIVFDASDLANARFDVTVNATSIDTGIGMRDNHLRKSEYFGVADFPTIRFISTAIEQASKPNEARVTGKLTIKKTTKEISFPFRYADANGILQLTGRFTINRRDFGVGGNSISLSDELTVSLDVRASR